MLERLAKKNKKWLNMAYKLSGNIHTAEDLVQDMYIKMYDLNKNQPFKEASKQNYGLGDLILRYKVRK